METTKFTLKDLFYIAGILVTLTGSYFGTKSSLNQAITRIEVVNAEQNQSRASERELNTLKIEAVKLEIERLKADIKEIKENLKYKR